MPKQVDHEARRAELVKAVWKVIAETGVEGVSLRLIAKEAGCTTGRISHYFADREDLLVAALQSVHDSAKRRMLALPIQAEPLALLRSVVLEALPLDEERLLEWKVWVGYWGLAVTTHRLAQYNADRYIEWQEAIRPLLRLILGRRSVDKELRTLMALIDGFGLQLAIGSTNQTVKETAAAVDAYLLRLGASGVI
jgi:TetR/AcrR family transcriptional regulator, transcriptional repressor of bet genes